MVESAARLIGGRVQSVALRLICQREAEIEAFQQEEYWSITGDFAPVGREQDLFSAKLLKVNGEKPKIPDGNGQPTKTAD